MLCGSRYGVNENAPACQGPPETLLETTPLNSMAELRWKNGGRNVCSVTSHRPTNTARSSALRPCVSIGQVSTVLIDGSGWSNVTLPRALHFRRSYLYC